MLAQPFLVFIEMVRVALGDDLEDRPVGRERHILLESRHADPRLAPDRPAIRCNLAVDELQQRRLPASVAADEGDPLARLDLQRHAIEQREVPVGVDHTVECDKIA